MAGNCAFCASVTDDGQSCTCATMRKDAIRIRQFESGAMRDTDDGKLDYEAMLSPTVLKRYAEYMHKNRKLKDGSLRDGDNWQKGIPLTAYAKSLFRHFMEFWTLHRRRLDTEITSYTEQEEFEDALCAIIFNASGYLHEQLRHPAYLAPAEAALGTDSITRDLDPPCPTYGWNE